MNAPVYAADAASQFLTISNAQLPLVRNRTKTAAMHTGRHDIRTGLLRLDSADGRDSCLVIVTRVAVTQVADVPTWALAGAGLTNVEDLFDRLRPNQPDISLATKLTSIEFAYAGEIARAA